MIRTLELFDFRNYYKQRFDFTARTVIVYGRNGLGKTNILEAISLLSVGKSWREKAVSDLILDTKESSLVRAQLVNQDLYEVILQSRSRQFKINDKKRMKKDYFGSLPSILFAPEYLSLFSGVKAERTSFFDRFLVQLSPEYRDMLSQCMKAIKQRNSLLKQENISRDVCRPWEELIASHLPQIVRIRREHIQKLIPHMQEHFTRIAGKSEPLGLSLLLAEEHEPTKEGVLGFFDQQFEREKIVKRTLLGPQRDDFHFTLRDKYLPTTASRGEERSVLLSLLAAQKDMLQEVLAIKPILLLDDVFSELDDERQARLAELCRGVEQVFLTTTHKEHFSAFTNDVQIIDLEQTLEEI